jgi:hypothetical protein
VIRYIPVLGIPRRNLWTALIGAKERSEIEIEEAIAQFEGVLTGSEIRHLVVGINILCTSVRVTPTLRVNGKSVRGIGSNEKSRR